jgi:hypothetical protein
VDLPDYIKKRHACINVGNTDKQCFRWAILSVLHPIPWPYHPNRVSNCVVRKKKKFRRNGLSGVAAGYRKFLKTKRGFRESWRLAEMGRNVQFELLCTEG